MNPPPYRPPREDKNIFARQFLKAALVALPFAALFGFLLVHSFIQQRKAAQTRAAWRDMASSVNQAQSNLKKNFNPKTGITNADFSDSDKLRQKLQDASQNLSGDDAIIARIGAEYLTRMQTAATNYQTAAINMRVAHVLRAFDSSDKSQLAARRQVVQAFLDANTAFKELIMNSEDSVRADLIANKIRQSKIDAYMQGFHSSAAPKNVLIIKIRQCDDRAGNAMLDVLNSLEAHWGGWQADPSIDQIRFKDRTALATYNADLAIVKAAEQEQLRLQAMVVNQPAPVSEP